MINVLLLGPYIGKGSFGGVANYNKLLIKNMPADKVRIIYFSLGKSPNWYRGKNPPKYMNFYFNHVYKLIKFILTLKFDKIDVVHIQSTFSRLSFLRMGVFSFFSKISCKPTIFFIRGWKPKEEKIIRDSLIWKILIFNFLSSFDKVGVLSNEFQIFLEKKIGLQNVFLSSTMVEIENYVLDSKSYEAPYEILFCGTMFKEKGVFELLDSVKSVVSFEKKVRFTFMGDGPELKHITKYAKRLGIENYVNFIGYKEDEEKYAIYKRSHMLILPSYTEGFPNVVCEAMASGLAIIGTKTGGIIDAIENGVNGYLLDSIPADPSEISNKVIKIVSEKSKLSQMGNTNFDISKKTYDARIVSKNISQIYLSLINHLKI